MEETDDNIKERVIRINVCGKLYEFDRKSLAKNRCSTLLEKFAQWTHEEREKVCQSFSHNKPRTYYIWRSPKLFECIINFIATGHVHRPQDTCSQEFLDELKFWEVNFSKLPDCCKEKLDLSESEFNYQNYSDEVSSMIAQIDETDMVEQEDLSLPETFENGGLSASILNEQKLTLNREKEAVKTPVDEFEGIRLGQMRRVLWITFEDPSSGIIAKAFTGISAGFVFISVVVLILGSMKEFQDAGKEPIQPLIRIEYVCVTWFTCEYIARLLITPLRWKFVKTPINIVDALSLFPFYLEVSFLIAGKGTTDDLQNWKGALLAMRVLRVFRVARVLKLARYSGGLKSFGTTLTSSKKEIGMLLMFLSTAMLLFSTSVYFFEKDHDDTPFTSIPATFWWAVVTMTTVGYGDMIPVSVGGKVAAGFATISGVIVLAFPITMIVENFNKHYQHSEKPAESSDDEELQFHNINHRRKSTVHVRSVAIV